MANRSVVFLIHGIGQHKKGWSKADDGPIAALETASKNFSCFNDRSLNEQVEFVEITYNDIFDKVLAQWDSLATSLRSSLAGKMPKFLDQLTEHLSKVGDGNTFIDFGGDVLLYRGLPIYARAVRLRVQASIASKIAKSTHANFGIIAHSMGTTVAHDALQQLSTNQWLNPNKKVKELANFSEEKKQAIIKSLEKHQGNPFSPKVENLWKAIFMVSNTSRLLHTTEKNPYKSVVRSGAFNDESAICTSFYNVDHKLDPVSKIKPFENPNWPNLPIMITDLNHIHDLNVHGFNHYLSHPKVYRRIFWEFAPDFNRSCYTRGQTLIEKFPQFGKKFKPDVQQSIKTKLAKIKSKASTSNNLKDLLDIYKELKDLA